MAQISWSCHNERDTSIFKERDRSRTLREIRDARYLNSLLPS